MDVPWHERFDQPAFTVEMSARPRIAKEWLATCVYHESVSRPECGWALIVGHQQELAAMILFKSAKMRIVWNRTTIVDGKWHHLAMTYDGRELKLFVDGLTSEQEELQLDPVPLGHDAGIRVGRRCRSSAKRWFRSCASRAACAARAFRRSHAQLPNRRSGFGDSMNIARAAVCRNSRGGAVGDRQNISARESRRG